MKFALLLMLCQLVNGILTHPSYLTLTLLLESLPQIKNRLQASSLEDSS